MPASAARVSGSAACLVALPVLITVGLTSGVLGDTVNTARGYLAFSSPTGPDPQEQIVQHPGLCVASESGAGGFGSHGSADGRSDYGYIVANAQAHGSLNAIGSGVVHDDLTFTVPGLAQFTAIQVTFSITVSGSLSCAANPGSGAVWSAGANMNGDGYEINPFGALYEGVPAGASMGTYSGTAIVPVGNPVPLELILDATVPVALWGANQPGDAAISNLTLMWGGISAVKQNGVPVASWSVTSASGTNWAPAISPPPPACPADFGGAGGLPGGDGVLDNNDFIVFIGWFFAQDSRADVGSAGGVSGPDGAFDNNDFIAFISLFFAGC